MAPHAQTYRNPHASELELKQLLLPIGERAVRTEVHASTALPWLGRGWTIG